MVPHQGEHAEIVIHSRELVLNTLSCCLTDYITSELSQYSENGARIIAVSITLQGDMGQAYSELWPPTAKLTEENLPDQTGKVTTHVPLPLTFLSPSFTSRP